MLVPQEPLVLLPAKLVNGWGLKDWFLIDNLFPRHFDGRDFSWVLSLRIRGNIRSRGFQGFVYKRELHVCE